MPDRYLQGSIIPEERFPSREVEFDCRGRMEVALDSSFACIDVGKLKSSAEVGTAIVQLGLRLKLLAWLVGTVTSSPPQDVRLVGRLFIVGLSIFDESQQLKAFAEWDFSLYMHPI